MILDSKWCTYCNNFIKHPKYISVFPPVFLNSNRAVKVSVDGCG